MGNGKGLLVEFGAGSVNGEGVGVVGEVWTVG